MAKHKFIARDFFTGYSILGMTCALTVIMWLVSSYHFTTAQVTQVTRKVIVNNKMSAVQITKADLEGKSLHLAVKNVSHKNLDWLRISFGNTESIEADFAFADPSALAPGETYEDVYTVESTSADLNITLDSALFEDRTFDGDASYVKAIKEKRAGQKMQLKRLLPLLQRVINAPQSNAASLLNELETEVARLRDETDKTIPEANRIGRRNAQERIVNEVQNIKRQHERDGGKDVRQHFLSVKERYEKILTKLEGYAL